MSISLHKGYAKRDPNSVASFCIAVNSETVESKCPACGIRVKH